MKSEQLKRRLRGSVITAIHPSYGVMHDSGAGTNGMRGGRTTLIIRAANSGDVSEAVRYANENGATISVRGCGCRFFDGEPNSDVVIDLAALNALRIDAATQQARVEPCVLTNQFAASLDRRALTFPLPGGGAVPMGDWLLGGGDMQGAAGLGFAQASIIAVEVVQSDGSFLTMAPSGGRDLTSILQEPGLACGGVVTAYRLRLQAAARSTVPWSCDRVVSTDRHLVA